MYYTELVERKTREWYGDLSFPAPGQIWRVKSVIMFPDGHEEKLPQDGARPDLVLLLAMDEDFQDNPHSIVQVFPITDRWIFASPHDLAFAPGEGSLAGLPFMIECWDPRPMLKVNLEQAVAKIDQKAMDDVRYLRSCVLHGTDPNEPLKSDGHIGPPINGDDDPRISFQAREFDRTDFLSIPVNGTI